MYITTTAGLLENDYNSLKLRHQNIVTNCMGVSVYSHLKGMTNVTGFVKRVLYMQL